MGLRKATAAVTATDVAVTAEETAAGTSAPSQRPGEP
jgi:hypothetical protein